MSDVVYEMHHTPCGVILQVSGKLSPLSDAAVNIHRRPDGTLCLAAVPRRRHVEVAPKKHLDVMERNVTKKSDKMA